MNCTGKRCIMQFDKVDPATCKCVSYCPQATPPKTNNDLSKGKHVLDLLTSYSDICSLTAIKNRISATDSSPTVNDIWNTIPLDAQKKVGVILNCINVWKECMKDSKDKSMEWFDSLTEEQKLVVYFIVGYTCKG